MADMYLDKTRILTAQNLLQVLNSDEVVTPIDDTFNLDSATYGIYRSWGKKPQNAPKNCVAWAKYFTLRFVADSDQALFQIAIDTSNNIFTRTKGGSPVSWMAWKQIGGVIANAISSLYRSSFRKVAM